jgi:histidinol dehydrogenase
VASAIDILATTEGLPSHADSVKLRVEDWPGILDLRF